MPFLDVQFHLTAQNALETDIFYKKTDSHNFVQFFSFHPHKTLTNIPFALARRICTIVSNNETRDTRLKELHGFLRKKQYPERVILNGFERAKAIDRGVLLQQNEAPSENNNIPFVHTFNSANPMVLDVIRQSTSLLTPSQRMTSVMNGRRIIAARRQPPNLKSLLFRPRFDGQNLSQNALGSVRPCSLTKKKTRGQPCKCCDNINRCNSFQFQGASEPFEIRLAFHVRFHEPSLCSDLSNMW